MKVLYVRLQDEELYLRMTPNNVEQVKWYYRFVNVHGLPGHSMEQMCEDKDSGFTSEGTINYQT